MQILNILPLSIGSFSSDTNPWVLWTFVILGLVIFVLSLTTRFWKTNWHDIKGQFDENGMRKMLMFNRQPYIMVTYLTVSIIVSAATGAAILFLVGGIVYGLLWLVKLIFWAIIFIGWISLILGGLALLGKEGAGCLPVVFGILVVSFEDTMKRWGETCVNAGFDFFNALNLWEFCQFLFGTYLIKVLTVAAVPIGLGLIAAILAVLCAFLFRTIEFVTTRKYNIKHPCPFCHNPSEPAVYLSDNVDLPIKLRPCSYGLLHITHPVTGEKMPTMLLNGRDNLQRRCPHCERIISYKTGVEKHIAFVGLPESGKTCLTYRFVGNLMKQNERITFTDDVSKEAQQIILDIKNGKEQDLASKTSVNDMRRSLQILVPGKAPLPYHFFINDVGGELFTTSGVESNYMQFFKDVESVSFLIDPFTMDFSDYDLSGDFGKWYKAHIGVGGGHKEKFISVLQTVKVISDQFAHKTDKIHVNLVLVKADTGYIPREILSDEAALRDVVTDQMGMAAEVMDLENTYASLHFYAVSALKGDGVDALTAGIIEDLKIKM